MSMGVSCSRNGEVMLEYTKIYSKKYPDIALKVIPGHFVTPNSHINYYMDMDEYKEQENYSMNKLADFVGDSVFNWKDIKEFIFSITVTPWSKIYRRDFIEKQKIRFPEGLVFDDNVFFWEVLFSAERITFHREHLFTRRWYSSSSTTAGDRRFIDSLAIYDLIWDVFKKFGVFEEFKK